MLQLKICLFNTDLIGPYRICADLSRSWILGDIEPTVGIKRDERYSHSPMPADPTKSEACHERDSYEGKYSPLQLSAAIPCSIIASISSALYPSSVSTARVDAPYFSLGRGAIKRALFGRTAQASS